MSFRLSILLFLRLSERPFLGLVARRIILLFVFTWCVHHGWLLPFGDVKFYMVYSNTFDIRFFWILSRCPIYTVSRDPILRGSFNSFCPSEFIVFHRPNSSEVSLLSARLAVYVGIFLSLVSCLSRGIYEILRRTDLLLKEMPQEVLSLPSVIFVSWRRRPLGIYSLLSNGLTLMDVFPSFMWVKGD